ncbi:MAG: AgmX/PglI C-terminal domain-containing protein [Myxococcales bacterium]
MLDALMDMVNVGGLWAWLVILAAPTSLVAAALALRAGLRPDAPKLAERARRLQWITALAFALAVLGVVGTWWTAGRLFAQALLEEEGSLVAQHLSSAFSGRSYVAALAGILLALGLPLVICGGLALLAMGRVVSRTGIAFLVTGLALGVFGMWGAEPHGNAALSMVLRAFSAVAFAMPSERDRIYMDTIATLPSLLQSARVQLASTVAWTGLLGWALVAVAGKRGLVASRSILLGAALWLAFGVAVFTGTRGLARDVERLPPTTSGLVWESFVETLPPPAVQTCNTRGKAAMLAIVDGEALDPSSGLPEPELAAKLAEEQQEKRLDITVAAAAGEPAAKVLRALAPLVPRQADVRLWAAVDAKGTLVNSLVGERPFVAHCSVPLVAHDANQPELSWQAWIDASLRAAPPEPASLSEALRRAAPEVAGKVDTPDALTAVTNQVRARIGAMQRCYEELLRATPTLMGRVEVEIKVTPDREVAEVVSAGANQAPANLTQCVLDQLAALDTPPNAEAFTLAFPFVFEPEP